MLDCNHLFFGQRRLVGLVERRLENENAVARVFRSDIAQSDARRHAHATAVVKARAIITMLSLDFEHASLLVSRYFDVFGLLKCVKV